MKSVLAWAVILLVFGLLLLPTAAALIEAGPLASAIFFGLIGLVFAFVWACGTLLP